MRRFAWMAAAAIAVACVCIASASSASSRAPALELVQRRPLTIAGTGFRPVEKVTVRTPAGRVTVRASRLGSFHAVFTGDRCTSGLVVAVGARGDRALLRLPRALCPPA